MIARALRALALAAGTCAFPLCAIPLCADASDFGPGVVTAIVRDTGGKPVSGVLVVAQGPSRRAATTSVAGIVTLVGLPTGTYDVSITRAGYGAVLRRVDVSSDPQTSALQISVARNTLAQSQGVASDIEAIALGGKVDALVGNVVETTREAELSPVRGSLSGAAPTLLGTSANETRVELDGIPIAGGPASFAALRFRNAVGLDSVDFERGPVVVSPTLQDAIGGIVDYRTASFDTLANPVGEIGYSSTFGSFQHVGTVRSFGPVGVVADAVTGGGENRTQTLKARFELSHTTSLDFASYGSQSSTTIGNVNVATVAPAYCANVRTSAGTATLQVRAFGSSVSTASDLPLALAGTNETDRTRGVAGSLDLPLGENLVSFAFDRRSDFWLLPQTTDDALARTYTSLSARGEFQLTKSSRFELGDEYAGGTSLQQRNDPHLGIAIHPTDRVTLRGSVGSSYAVAPGDLVLALPDSGAPLRPETAFGYRASIDDDVDGLDRIDASLFDLRRFDRFATYSAARTFGVDVGFAHHPLTGGLGGDADLTLQRANAFGTVQPVARVLDVLDGGSFAQLAGDPYYTFHSNLSYVTKRGFSAGFVDTLIGANNDLSPQAIGFVDFAANVPLANAGSVRLGENNLFGTKISQPLLAPYYTPHEFTLVFRFGGGSPVR